ncbi:fungal-specific transcription factor domain-containing protein [Trichoderma sp. SZMC 28015]
MQGRRRPYDYSKPRPNYPRFKTGCLSCRLRKKKCDEVKPRCRACCRNHLECQWPDLSGGTSQPNSGSKPAGREAVVEQLPIVRAETQSSSPISTALSCQSPTHDLPIPGTACNLTQVSITLLQHYSESTAGLLCTSPPTKSPFITVVLPLASTDELIMHTILALSGMHLECRQSARNSGSIGSVNLEVQRATALHYQNTISGLRRELLNFDSANDRQQARLLLILIIACHYEAISGNKSGMMLQHLRASREIVGRLLTQPQRGNIDRDSLGFSLELYAYLSIVNSLASYRSIGKLAQPYDTFLTSLDELSSYSTFGSMFGGCHSLYELIPRISQLGVEYLAGQSILGDDWIPGAELQSCYKAIEQRIITWTMPPSADSLVQHENSDITTAAEVIRHGLYIYLMTSFCGAGRPDPISQLQIEAQVDIVLALASSVKNMRSRTILLWPCIIAGSCMTKEEQQKHLKYELLHSGFDMKHLFSLSEMLERMWSDDDVRAYGPYGLYLTMEKSNHYIPIM